MWIILSCVVHLHLRFRLATCQTFTRDIHFDWLLKLFGPSFFDYYDLCWLLVVRCYYGFFPPTRPHGISPEPFLVYPPNLHISVTVAFWTLLSIASLSSCCALLLGFCSSGHDFAIASSRPYLAMWTLQVAIGFVGNYAPWDFLPSFGTYPSYRTNRLFSYTRVCL